MPPVMPAQVAEAIEDTMRSKSGPRVGPVASWFLKPQFAIALHFGEARLETSEAAPSSTQLILDVPGPLRTEFPYTNRL
jgi:hypothetical protein